MTTDDSQTRRDYLRTVSTTGAVLGGSVLGVSSASADGQPDDHDPTGIDPAKIRLEATCVDADHDAALFCVENDTDEWAHLEWRTTPVEDGIEFLDCQTVRVVGDFTEVMVDASFDTDAGIGNTTWQFGPVDGSAVVDIADIDEIPENSIVNTVDAFREGTPVVPHGGDISVENREYEACQEDHFGEVVDSPSSDPATQTTASDEDATSGPDSDDGRNALAVPPNETRRFVASGDDGLATVALFSDGERIGTASSTAADDCSIPIRWWRWYSAGRDCLTSDRM
ncbi:hypothetical protein [Natrinema sp. SYSU A 869]|uniref:hypothetical protein n=1 Tax=Natrinema sp. SYSU A 869 TaxID=2871694 RepID=UPI001CA3BACF|nr:hypothetical protein [Natrinema sp. SYSU A 869]